MLKKCLEQFLNVLCFYFDVSRRAAQDMVMFQPHAVAVTKDSLNQAMEWVRTLDGVAATTETSACEGILKAFTDRNVSLIYSSLLHS